mgnify:CR=1 FL=1
MGFPFGSSAQKGGKGNVDKATLEAISRSQAVIEFNLDGTIITANPNFCNAVGYALSDIKGRHHRMFVEPAYGSSMEYQQFWESLRRGEFQAAEYRRVGAGGRVIWSCRTRSNAIYPVSRTTSRTSRAKPAK